MSEAIQNSPCPGREEDGRARPRPPPFNMVNKVGGVPNAVGHMSAAGSFGLSHAVMPPAGNDRVVAVVGHAVVGTMYRSFATTLGKKG